MKIVAMWWRFYKVAVLPHDLFFYRGAVLSVQPPGTGCTGETLYLRSMQHTWVLQLAAAPQLLAGPLLCGENQRKIRTYYVT